MLNRAAKKNRDIRCAATDIDNAGTELFLVVCQHRVTRGELLEDDIVNFEAAALHTFYDVLGRAFGARHHVHLRFKANP